MEINVSDNRIVSSVNNQKQNHASIIATLIVLLFLIFSSFYFYNHSIIMDGALTDGTLSSIVIYVDSAEFVNDKLIITGWCFNIGDDYSDTSKLPSMRVILAETGTDAMHYFNAQYGLPRPEVNEYYSDGNDYNNCGFCVEINPNSLDLYNMDYEIAIQQDKYKKDIVRSRVFLHNGGLVYGMKSIYEPLDVEGTDLEAIEHNGIPYMCNPDLGLYLYLYDERLYYIADDKYPFDNGWDLIACHVGTTKTELLPEYSQKHGYGFELLDFYFENNEITDQMNCGKYRVAVIDLPDTYPITSITTGHGENGIWTWIYDFYPGIK